MLLWEYFQIGITGFGGGLQGRFYHLAVKKHDWLTEEEFADVNATASLAPGGNASNVGLEIARRVRGLPGMLAAYLCLLLPGSVVMLMLGQVYETYRHMPAVRGGLEGLEAAATALILYSATKLNLPSWKWVDYPVAVVAGIAMIAYHAPLFLVVPLGGLVSLLLRRRVS